MGDPYPGKIKYLGGKAVRLSYTELIAALGLAGWPESTWAKAGAVFAAESDRVVNIYNTYKSGHFGIAQISASDHQGYFKGLANAAAWVEPVGNLKYALSLYDASGWKPWEAATNGRYSGFLLQSTAAADAVKGRIKKDQLAPGAPASMGPHGKVAVLQSYFKAKDGVTELIAAVQLGQAQQDVGDLIASGAEATGRATVDSGAAVAAAMQANSIFGAVEMLAGAGRWIANPGSWFRVAQVLAGGALLIAGISIVAKPMTGGVISALPVGKVASLLKGKS